MHAAMLCVFGASLCALAAVGSAAERTLDVLVEPRIVKQEGAQVFAKTWTGKKTMDRSGSRKPFFYVTEADGSRGPMIRKLQVKVVQNPGKRAEEKTDTIATVSFWFYNGASAQDESSVADRQTALIFTVREKDGTVIGRIDDEGNVVEGRPEVALPMWRCWYGKTLWPEKPHVEQAVKLRDRSFAEIASIDVALREGPAGERCPGGRGTARLMP